MWRFTKLLLIASGLIAIVSHLAADAQMDLDRSRWKIDNVKAELSAREKDLSEAQQALLKRRDDIDRGIALYVEERQKTENELTRVRHELNRIHLELLQ